MKTIFYIVERYFKTKFVNARRAFSDLRYKVSLTKVRFKAFKRSMRWGCNYENADFKLDNVHNFF